MCNGPEPALTISRETGMQKGTVNTTSLKCANVQRQTKCRCDFDSYLLSPGMRVINIFWSQNIILQKRKS